MSDDRVVYKSEESQKPDAERTDPMRKKEKKKSPSKVEAALADEKISLRVFCSIKGIESEDQIHLMRKIAQLNLAPLKQWESIFKDL